MHTHSGVKLPKTIALTRAHTTNTFLLPAPFCPCRPLPLSPGSCKKLASANSICIVKNCSLSSRSSSIYKYTHTYTPTHTQTAQGAFSGSWQPQLWAAKKALPTFRRPSDSCPTAATKGSCNLITVAKIQIHSRRCTAAQEKNPKKNEKMRKFAMPTLQYTTNGRQLNTLCICQQARRKGIYTRNKQNQRTQFSEK